VTEATLASSPHWLRLPHIWRQASSLHAVNLLQVRYRDICYRRGTVYGINTDTQAVSSVNGERKKKMASALHNLNEYGIPRFDDLPLQKGDPPHSAWGLYGKNDELGTLNRLTDERVVEAAKAEIQSGVRLVFLCFWFAFGGLFTMQTSGVLTPILHSCETRPCHLLL
jgi:hypothetical protein